jgi:hypothetical protein
MTLEEAKKVANVCKTADNGCPTCVGNICDMLNKVFTEFNWIFKRRELFSSEDSEILVELKDK